MGGTCTADCSTLGTSCESGPLAPGTYTVIHGEDRATIVLPATQPVQLFPGNVNHCLP